MLFCVSVYVCACGARAHQATELTVFSVSYLCYFLHLADQIGATPGLKLTVGTLGHGVNYEIERVALSPAHVQLLEGRLLCVGTAMTRVAKTVLIGVVEEYCYGAAGNYF
jgi:hypothetical protein